MHPRMMSCCAPRHRGETWGASPREMFHHHMGPGAGGGGFGVRRPLRFLAWRLQLGDAQVAELARILNELKTERAQAEVDERRALTAYADAMAAESFDEAKVSAAALERNKSAERVQVYVAKALSQIHALLEPEQREKFAYLLRTGAVVM